MTKGRTIKVDIHTHTCYSGWRHLKIIHAKDCYSDPYSLWLSAKNRGMDMIAITDHNEINGAVSLLKAHPELKPFIIVGEEVEARFPETGQWLHIGVLGIDERQHELIKPLRKDVRALVRFLVSEGLTYILNHPFQSFLFQKSKEKYLDDIITLFPVWEGLNGSLPAYSAEAASYIGRVTGKVLVAGSDAHTLSRSGRAYTCSNAHTKEGFLASMRSGSCWIGGEAGSTADLALGIHTVIWHSYKHVFGDCIKGNFDDFIGFTLGIPFIFGGLPLSISLLASLRYNLIGLAFLEEFGYYNYSKVYAMAEKDNEKNYKKGGK